MKFIPRSLKTKKLLDDFKTWIIEVIEFLPCDSSRQCEINTCAQMWEAKQKQFKDARIGHFKLKYIIVLNG